MRREEDGSRQNMEPAEAWVWEQLAAGGKALASLDYEMAGMHFRAALDLDPECPEALHGMGFVRMMGYSDFEEGLRLMEEAARRAPDDRRIADRLAQARAMLAKDPKVTPG